MDMFALQDGEGSEESGNEDVVGSSMKENDNDNTEGCTQKSTFESDTCKYDTPRKPETSGVAGQLNRSLSPSRTQGSGRTPPRYTVKELRARYERMIVKHRPHSDSCSLSTSAASLSILPGSPTSRRSLSHSHPSDHTQPQSVPGSPAGEVITPSPPVVSHTLDEVSHCVFTMLVCGFATALVCSDWYYLTILFPINCR